MWQRWVRQPKNLWLRRALFQVHLFSGVAVGLYILMISVTGSALVYSNELYTAATPEPIISQGSTPRLTDDELEQAATHLYPGYRVVRIGRARNLDQAVDVWLRRGNAMKQRLLDPRSGSDLGGSVPTGIWLISKLVDLHDNLLAGTNRSESERYRRTRSARTCCYRSRDLVAGNQDMESEPDAASRRGMEALHLALAQHDRLLESRIHAGVWLERSLSQ
jgi:hypothetical protein